MMAKILVVDDEADIQDLIRQKFRKKIKTNEYNFVFALNGREALEVLDDTSDIDMILSDINMPEMDGLTLLSNLKERNDLLKTVIVSAYGDMKNLRIAMNRGAYDFVTKPIDFDDLERTIQKTYDHVTGLRKTIAAMKENNILKMYVDEDVINFMGSRSFESTLMASEKIEASVMFVDICGFTTMSQAADPADIVEFLNGYFDVMVKEIVDQNGLVDKFLGDAILAVFKGEDHAVHAAQSALQIRKAIDDLPSASFKIGYKPHVSIGINCGEMISGNIGSESLKRLDYTVIGATVNIAQRLESIAEENQIVISESLHHLINSQFKCTSLGTVNLKHVDQPMAIYEMIE